VGDYCFASYLVRVQYDKTRLTPEFLNYQMNSGRFQSSVKRKASRSINQANINATILSNEYIVVPNSLKEQQRLAAGFDTLRVETLRLESLYRRKLAALDELKNSLLHRAFNGDL
jgi:type I restriction enzyme S subunit